MEHNAYISVKKIQMTSGISTMYHEKVLQNNQVCKGKIYEDIPAASYVLSKLL
jgi:hypothetical protein